MGQQETVGEANQALELFDAHPARELIPDI
jgi:hypothetical protein